MLRMAARLLGDMTLWQITQDVFWTLFSSAFLLFEQACCPTWTWEACQRKPRERMDGKEEESTCGGGVGVTRHVLNILGSSKRTRGGLWEGGEMKQDGALCLSWLYWHQWEHLDEMENETPSCVLFMSTWSLFPTCSHTHWQSEAGVCGSSPVTAACSEGGDASGVAPHIGEACLCWPWINNFSFSAEMTGIAIKEMEWFYWPWCLY